MTRRLALPCPPADDRFWSMVDRSNLDGCWPWMGHCEQGYGRVNRHNVVYRAHRIAFVDAFGEPAADLVVDHLCRNRSCCNPLHMEAVPHVTNVMRGQGVGVLNNLVTHCPKGHPYSEANTYIIPATGGRACRKCRRASKSAESARRRARQRLGLGPGRPGRRPTTPKAALAAELKVGV